MFHKEMEGLKSLRHENAHMMNTDLETALEKERELRLRAEENVQELNRKLEKERESKLKAEKNVENERKLRLRAEEDLKVEREKRTGVESELMRQNEKWKNAFPLGMQSCDKTSDLADAAYRGDFEVVQLLLKQGAGASSRLAAPRDWGNSVTPLHEAVRGQHVHVCRVLSEAAKSYIKSSDILCYAALASSGDVCEVLINTGADVNAMSSRGYSALQTAVGFQHTYVCKLLIDAGANVNAMDIDGSTALHSAAQSGNMDVVHLLTQNKADLSIKNNKGHTALELAQQSNHQSVVKYLQQRINSS